MKKIGIFYGTSTGNTEEVAKKIAGAMGVASENVHDVAKNRPSMLGDYDVIIMGSPTYGLGELQDDWYDFVDGAQALDLNGKVIALFGCGDESMADTFCGAVGELYDKFKDSGAEFVGSFDASCYNFTQSSAVRDGVAVGLLVDEVNHPDLTPGRVKSWSEEVMKSI